MSVATRKNLSQSIRIYAAIVATRQTDTEVWRNV